MARFRVSVIFMISLMLIVLLNPFLVQEKSGVEGWTDGNKDSPVYPHYGIVDLLVDQAYRVFNGSNFEKAEYLRYWYKWDGADSESDSFDPRTKIATYSDNLLAWTDDDARNDGDKANFFIHNSKGWETTDAPTTAQQWADWAVENLTTWFMNGKPEVSSAKHRAAYCVGRMSRYISKMAQYSRTDYSQLDQVNFIPQYDPNEVSYQKYYEAYLWNDESMTELAMDFRNRTFQVPIGHNASTIYNHTADVARFVNSRDGSTVSMVDHDGSTITVGKTYKEMLDQFIYCWDTGVFYNDTVRGFNDTLWELTIENMVAVTQNLSAIYGAIYDMAQYNFITTAPDLTIVDFSYEPSEVLANDMVTVNATIRNNGPTSTRDAVIIEISTTTGFVNTRPVALEAYQEKNVTFSPFQIGTGNITVNLMADSQETLAEPNEMDNTLQFGIDPIPEVFESEIELAVPFTTIRKDTIQPIKVAVNNLGNRYDEFIISGSTTTGNVFFDPPDDPVGVEPGTTVIADLLMITIMDTELGQVTVSILAEGDRSQVEIEIVVDVLDRSKDPIPVITGPDWTRVGMNISLSAIGSTDPDGDSLYFTWRVPEWGNYTGPEVTFNYTREGSYDVVLEVYDGNLTVEQIWTIVVYPQPLDNLSSMVTGKDASGITVSWSAWKAGGLVAYWIVASALPEQGDLSSRGPFEVRVSPGTTEIRIGGFHPGTDIEIEVKVQTEIVDNRTMDILTTNTTGISSFETSVNFYIELLDEGPYLYLQYKPWLQPESNRMPSILIERWAGSFIEIPSETMEEVQTTKAKDTVRYPVLSNWGLYKASLTYTFAEGNASAFVVETDFEQKNSEPETAAVNLDQKWELNVNGTCSMHIILELKDPNDHITVEADWGDGTTSTEEFTTSSSSVDQIDIYHDYTEVGTYSISLKITDWSGDVWWVNETVEVHEYSPPADDDSTRLIIMIIIAVIATIFIVGMLIFLGKSAYKFAKKDTEVEFDMDQIKSKKVEKAGTGTDFDERRDMQIPQESIMGSARKRTIDEEEETETTELPDDAPMIKESIVFDDEEE